MLTRPSPLPVAALTWVLKQCLLWAEGGYATGGRSGMDRTIRGGKGIGGDSKGETGSGGGAFGGITNASNGSVKAGGAAGGQFQENQYF